MRQESTIRVGGPCPLRGQGKTESADGMGAVHNDRHRRTDQIEIRVSDAGGMQRGRRPIQSRYGARLERRWATVESRRIYRAVFLPKKVDLPPRAPPSGSNAPWLPPLRAMLGRGSPSPFGLPQSPITTLRTLSCTFAAAPSGSAWSGFHPAPFGLPKGSPLRADAPTRGLRCGRFAPGGQ